MREYVAKTGGRYTYIEDFIGLQELSLSLASIFDGCKNFIISGCKTTGNNNNMDISAGYVYINGKIRHFEGATVDLSNPYYIVESERTESVSYAQNATQQGCIHYECFGTNERPLDKQYIKITDSYIPRLKDEFFGKYAVTLDSSFEQQTISKNIVMEKNLYIKGNIVNDSNFSIKNPDKQVELEEKITSEGNAQFTFLKDGKESSRLLFGFDDMIRFISDGIEKLVITPTNVAINELMTNEIRNKELLISGTDIYNYFDNSENGSININRSGYDGGATKSRHFNVYNGKRKLLFRSDGAMNMNYSYCTINEESRNEFGLVLRDTAHKYGEPEYRKSIAWEDLNGVIMGSVGFSETSQNDLRIKHCLNGDVTLLGRRVNIIGELQNNGETLSSKYVSKNYVDEELKKKVNAEAGKVLSEVNFTAKDKDKLDRINPDDYANGDDINQAVSGALKASNNLSDVHDKSSARSNLSVYSKNECDTAYLRKDKKLTDLPTLNDTEKAAIRAKIGAGASTIEGEIESIKASMKNIVKDYCDPIFALKSTTGICTAQPGNGLTFVQVGGVVSVGGMIEPKGNAGNWFVIPNSIGAPATYICGTINTGIGKEDINYGLVWECQANDRTVTCPIHYWPDKQGRAVRFHCTYVTKQKPANANEYL
jgi:hypothetical protein